MAEMIPDLTHYSGGLDPATFPVHVRTEENEVKESLSVIFKVITLEQVEANIQLDGRGFHVLSLIHRTDSVKQTSERQQQAISGAVYETIEALLMALSPAFEVFFGQELARKLGSISWEPRHQQSDNSESDSGHDEQESQGYV